MTIRGITSRREFLRGSALMTGAALATRVIPHTSLLPASFALDMRGQMAADPRRPEFHLLPAANWMNDPNGPIYWKGKYHMFYQYNPNGAYWGDMHWGHAVSPDMVHWEHRGIALAPTPGGPDAAGCFTGTAVVDGDRVALLYTGVVSAPEKEATIRDGEHSLRESQCLAFSSDENLEVWNKEAKPVIALPPAGIDVSGFRDPTPWRHGEWWYMVVGSGIRGKNGAVLLYRSRDLRQWEYLHLLAQGAENGNLAYAGDMWECPDFFPLSDKYVLIHSWAGKSYWHTGAFDYDQLVFHPEQSGVLDYGSFYAPKSQLDEHKNRILWGWIPETRPLEEYRASGWAGVMSLPRVLTLDEHSRLSIKPVSALEKLRQSSETLLISGNEKQKQQKIAQMHIRDCCGEVLCKVKTAASVFRLSILGDGKTDAVPWLSVLYDPGRANIIKLDEKERPLDPVGASEFEMRFFIDGSVIEVFVNHQVAYTKRFYYSGSSAPAAVLKIDESTSCLSSLNVWQLSPISSNRLTI